MDPEIILPECEYRYDASLWERDSTETTLLNVCGACVGPIRCLVLLGAELCPEGIV